jgi:predicted nucleic acid-binding protein
MNLFIDTNVYLSFYHLSNDDLEELNKLIVLVRTKKIGLFVPEQVKHEFLRNRENKIADALKRLRDQRLNLQFPQICKDYEEFEALRSLQREYEKKHADLLKKINRDVSSKALKADSTIQELFKLATTIPTKEQILDKARTRVDLGNPPGKNGSLGDAVNWEALIITVKNDQDLYFITDDKDYYSVLDDKFFNEFLLYEWADNKSSKLMYYRRLSEFFKMHYPDIRLGTEFEKDRLIRELAQSGSFAQTHALISELSQFSDFSPAQTNDIIEAAIHNTQVSWIINDQDVQKFLWQIIESHEKRIDTKKLEVLKEQLKPVLSDKDIPF